MSQNISDHKLVSVCIIGKPNAGKSTLTNAMLGEKLSIVTPKVQTTRSIITGIVTINNTQLVLFDTPGIFEPKKKLEKAMVRCAWSSLNGADIVAILIDSTAPLDDKLEEIIKRVKNSSVELVFLMNKTDLTSKYYIDNLSFVEKISPKTRIFNISALKKKNIEEFIAYLIQRAKPSEWLYEEEAISNLPMRFLAAEITREQLFLQLQQELPYNLTVDYEKWENKSDGSIKIDQVIIVSKAIYKNMIIGKNGARIKEIGTKARQNIEKLTGTKVHLFLFVKVREKWEDDPHLYDRMGLSKD